MRRVCVMGLGYVGLPTAIIFASKGLRLLVLMLMRIRLRLLMRVDAILRSRAS